MRRWIITEGIDTDEFLVKNLFIIRRDGDELSITNSNGKKIINSFIKFYPRGIFIIYNDNVFLTFNKRSYYKDYLDFNDIINIQTYCLHHNCFDELSIWFKKTLSKINNLDKEQTFIL